MRVMTRGFAALTVAAGVLLAPIFTRLTVIPDRDLAPIPAESRAAVRPLPATWPTRVASLLRRDPMPVEQTDLDAMLRHVDRAAKRFGLDPLTILAVIKVESGFDPFAISAAGAMGLMQLRLDTAQDLAARLGVEWTHDDLVFDPEINILLGTAYLRELLDRFDNLDVALAAFHAGPNRIAARKLHLGAASVQYTDRVWDAIVALHKTARV